MEIVVHTVGIEYPRVCRQAAVFIDGAAGKQHLPCIVHGLDFKPHLPDYATSGNSKPNGDYHIRADAAEIIDTANPASTTTDDIDGEGRPNYSGFGRGADEYIITNRTTAKTATAIANGESALESACPTPRTITVKTRNLPLVELH